MLTKKKISKTKCTILLYSDYILIFMQLSIVYYEAWHVFEYVCLIIAYSRIYRDCICDETEDLLVKTYISYCT